MDIRQSARAALDLPMPGADRSDGPEPDWGPTFPPEVTIRRYLAALLADLYATRPHIRLCGRYNWAEPLQEAIVRAKLVAGETDDKGLLSIDFVAMDELVVAVFAELGMPTPGTEADSTR